MLAQPLASKSSEIQPKMGHEPPPYVQLELRQLPPEQPHSTTPEGNSTTQEGHQVESKIPPIQFWTLSVGVLLGLFLSMVDTSIVATSIYAIGAEYEDLERVNWVALAYTLAYLGCAVVFARISDIVGRRNAFIAAYVLFVAFSLACGFATSLNQLIAFRALQGVGGSGLYSLTMIILPELSPEHLRQHIGALIGMIVAFSGILGPVLGGVFTHYTTWRWVFWINGPVGVVSLTIFVLTWPKAEYLPSIQRRSWRELDYLGSLLAVAAAVLVVLAFQSTATLANRGWNSAMFLAPLLTGLFAWGLLISWQLLIQYRYKNRFASAFPVYLFRNRVYTTAVLNTLLLGFPYLLLIYAIPIRIQVVSGQSSLTAGVMLLPMLGTSALGSMASGRINAVKNYTSETLLAGSIFMTLGCGLLMTLDDGPDDAKLLGFITFCGLGFGLTVASSTMLSSVEVPIRDFAPAQGILSQARLLGGSLGIAVSSVFLHRDISDNLTGIMTASEISMIGGPNTHLSAAQLQAIRKTYAKAFGMDMKAAVAVAALGIVCTAGAYRKKRLTIPEQRQALVAQHIADVRSATMEAETVQDKSAHSAPETCLPRSSIGV